MGNEREKRFAGYILNALQELHEAAEDANAVATHRSLIAAIVENLNEYRAELHPEPTANDREEAEDLAIAFVDLCEKENCRLHRIDTIAPAIEVALSAARGNRAELEAAAGEFFEAEELECAAEMRTCPKATISEINEARDRRKAAHDALAAILLEVKA